MQIGQLVAFINYLTQSLMALMMISMLMVRVARARVSADRVSELLASRADLDFPAAPATPDLLRGRVVFEAVSFGYGGAAGNLVLRDISFVAEPGQTVALLGATGAGKSSIAALVARFYDVRGGRVTINGIDVRDLDQQTLRRTVVIALQETVLFSGTIRDNIAYGRPAASDAEVQSAAEAAQAHDFIARLADGYGAIVGQRGVNLSGGQKQRIAIARAMLLQPAVFILDDSTSAVDTATEARIKRALDATRHAQTRIIVAQRISTVQDADTILVIDDGQIIAAGNHTTLLATSPVYRAIVDSQTEHEVILHDNA